MRIEKHLKKSLQIEIMFQATLYGQTEHKLSVSAWIHWRVRMRKMFETLSMLEHGIRPDERITLMEQSDVGQWAYANYGWWNNIWAKVFVTIFPYRYYRFYALYSDVDEFCYEAVCEFYFTS